VLLAERLGIQLRQVGSGRRLTFAAGEAKLSAWMADNARSHRAEAHQGDAGRFGSDERRGVQPRQLGRLLTMSMQDESRRARSDANRA
jgi:hypothetical protein